jgi:phosphate transport system protein
MTHYLDEDIKSLKGNLFQMWTLVNSQIEKSRIALLNFDKKVAMDVRANEKRVDAFELKMDMDCESLVLLKNPVAVDLRFIIAVLKMNYNLERIGDYANKIAKSVVNTDQKFSEEVFKALHVPEIFFLAQSMLSEGIEAFQDDDKDKILGLFNTDEKLDKLHADATLAAIALGKRTPENLEEIIKVLTAIRMLERSGDHLLNIAEEFVFYLDAQIIKHSKLQKKDKQH